MISRLIVITALLFTTSAFAGNQIKGEVKKIISGDTIVVETDKGNVEVRLYGINAPESGQNFGRESRKLLGDLIDDEDVRIKVVDIDDYNVLIGKVYYDGEYINATMLKEGAAWYDKENAYDNDLKQAEKWSKERGAGLWKHITPTPIYIIRHHQYSNPEDSYFCLNLNLFNSNHSRYAKRDKRYYNYEHHRDKRHDKNTNHNTHNSHNNKKH